MDESLRIMMERILTELSGNEPTMYLYGSVVLGDFRSGWSDIDILCLCDRPLTAEQARKLVGLRQTLMRAYPGNPYFRLFEGGILSWDAFLKEAEDTVVYWGTSGQRVTDRYAFDPFSAILLKQRGRLLCGPDRRGCIPYPSERDIADAVRRWHDITRRHAQETPGKVSSAGWLLDIARCLYTLETGGVIAKTEAGRWALAQGLAPDADVLSKAVTVRENPEAAMADAETVRWLAALGPHIQRFADVLEARIEGLHAAR